MADNHSDEQTTPESQESNLRAKLAEAHADVRSGRMHSLADIEHEFCSDAAYRAYVMKKLAEGERAIEEGRVTPHDEVRRRLDL